MDSAPATAPSAGGLPPGPRLPPAAQLAWWVARPVSMLERCAARFGEQFTIRFPRYPPMVFTWSPDTVRDVFAADPAALHAGKGNRILRPLLGDASLLLLDGEPHRRERRRVVPALHGERMRAHAATMAAAADEAIDRWPRGRPFPVLRELQRLTLEIILRTIFGVTDPHRLELFRERVSALLGFASFPPVVFMVRREGDIVLDGLQRRLGRWSPWGRFLELRAGVETLLAEEFRRRRAGEDTGREDVLSLLVAARDEEGRALGDEALRDQMMTMLVAGHETTATALAWALDCLLADAGALERAREEVAQQDGDVPDPARLAWLDAVVRETLRLRPVIPIVARHVERSCRLGAVDLPAGSVVAPVVWLTQRHPHLWPDPEAFRPERFVERGRVRPWAWLPFGGGARTCVGMAFALYEIKLVLARILTRTTLRLAPGYRSRVVRRSVTFAPARGGPLVTDGR